jgi:IS30 family transposase
MIPESLRIINRPEEIEARLVPGHWEGDLIKGAFNRSSVGTLVERRTRFVVLCRMRGNGADAVLDSFTRQMKRLPAALRKSMTYDRGSEMACHPELARRLKIDIWLGRSARTPLGDACIACRAVHGSAAATRTPTACCASSCRRARIWAT